MNKLKVVVFIASFIAFQQLSMSANGYNLIQDEPDTTKVVLSMNSMDSINTVNIGYETINRSALTGAIVSLKNDEINDHHYTQINQVLRGSVAGVHAIQYSGAPGAPLKVRIRGANSILGSNDPLYVVDGMIVSNVDAMNLNEVQSIEILKDASATAIYGSRGANGVILVTTKNGRKGKLSVNLDLYYGISNFTKRLPLMDAADFAENANLVDWRVPYTDEEISILRENGGEDWQEQVFQTAPVSNTNFSITGGNKSFDYYVSGNYLNQGGVIIGQDYKRYTYMAKLNAELSPKVKLGVSLSRNRALTNGEAANLATALTFDPTTPVYNDNGEYNLRSLKEVANTGINPVAVAKSKIVEDTHNQLLANMHLTYQITKELTFNFTAGLENLHQTDNEYTPILIDNKGSAKVSDFNSTRYRFANVLSYRKEIGGNKISIDAIYEYEQTQRDSKSSSASGFPSDETSYKNLQLASTQNIGERYADSRNLISYAGRVNYSLFDRYEAGLTLRVDGSKIFNRNTWEVFPSVSFGWKVSEEAFMKDLAFISDFTIRGGYGRTGMQFIDPFYNREVYPVSGVGYTYTNEEATEGVVPSDWFLMKDLPCEKTKQTDFGIDLSLFSSKIDFSFNWYKKKSTGLYLDITLPDYIGANKFYKNSGAVENKGHEFSLGVIAVDSRNWKINSQFNLSVNINEVLALDVYTSPWKGESYSGYNSEYFMPAKIVTGKPLGSLAGYIFDGVYQLGDENFAKKYGRKPGDARYRDVPTSTFGIGDGVIDVNDITVVGDGNPDYICGLNTDITYKKLNLIFLVSASRGNEVYNLLRGIQMRTRNGENLYPLHPDYNNHWTPENPSNIPAGDYRITELLSSQFIEDGSYIRLSNVSLSYSLDENEIIKKVGAKSARIYSSAENLFTITNYRGLDPEAKSSGNSDINLGVDYGAYPLPRTFIFGVSLTF